MTLVTCRECKHWYRGTYDDPNATYDDGFGDAAQNIGSCGASFGPDQGACTLIPNNEHDPDAQAYVFAGYDLITRPTFSCSLGEPKDITQGGS